MIDDFFGGIAVDSECACPKLVQELEDGAIFSVALDQGNYYLSMNLINALL